MRIVLTGGGTGGHIYPALTLWRHLSQKHPDAEVLYIGTSKGLEQGIVGHEGIRFEVIRAAGLKREVSLKAIRTVLETYAGFRRAKRILKEFRPDVVVGTGGYVTLPVVYAASKLRIPSVIWEANARPGLTNQLCAKKAEAVAVSFPGTERWFKGAKRVALTGNPRASEVQHITPELQTQARQTYGIDAAKKLILCFAGSRGAETINRVLVELLPRLEERPDWQMLYVTGEAHYHEIDRMASPVPSNVRILPFIHDMPAVLPQAAVAVTRAGGATLAEICSLGVPSILIPSPYVTANHQEENAKPLVEHKAAKMIRESDLSAGTLWDALAKVLDSDEHVQMRENALQLATPQAVADLYDLVMRAAGANLQ